MSRIFRIHQNSTELINIAKTLLWNENVIAIPTDTIYGLAASVNCSNAIKKLYEIKSRDLKKPLAICVGDVDDIYQYAKVTIPNQLLNQLLPGATTVIFQRTQQLNPFLNADTDLVGIRIPDNDFVRQLCRQSGAIALTSANMSTEPSCLSIEEFKHMWPSISAIFDGGTLGHIDPNGFGSTVIDFSRKGFYRILRDGCAFKQTTQILTNYGLQLSN